MVSEPAHFAPALQRALQHSRSGRAVVQHYEVGFQGTAEGCLLGGEIRFSFITQRCLPKSPMVATAGHTMPSGLSPHQTERILDDVKTILTSLSILDTVFDAGDEPKFLELTPRLGGNSLGHLARYHCDVSLEDMAIDLALTGATSAAGVESRPYGGTSKVVLLHSDEGGRLVYDPTRLTAAREVDGIRRLVLDCDPGKVVAPFVNGRHRFGEIIAQGPTAEAADASIDRALATLALRIV